MKSNKKVVCTIALILACNNTLLHHIYTKEIKQQKQQINKLELDVRNQLKTNDKLDKTINNISYQLQDTKDKLNQKQLEYKKLQEKLYQLYKIPSWNDCNVTKASNTTPIQLSKALNGTNLEGLENAYCKAEKEYGVNALFLTGLTACESGWGNSQRAREQNNLSGYAVYSNASRGTSFNSKEHSIMATAKLLKEDYINQGLISIYDINNKYCVNPKWSNMINEIINYDLIPYTYIKEGK